MTEPSERAVLAVEDLERIALVTWPGRVRATTGLWILRAGGGGSRRANSVLVLGEPALTMRAALERAEGWYADHGLGVCLQVPESLGTGAALHPEGGSWLRDLPRRLGERGWQSEKPTYVMTLDLEDLVVDALLLDGPPVLAAGAPGPGVRWSANPDADFWGLDGSDAARREEATLAPARYGVLRDDAGRAVAAARIALSGVWSVLSNITVAPDLRRRGHGRAVVLAALAEARRLGACHALLQVPASNATARALYRGLGFVDHHRTRYWRPVAARCTEGTSTPKRTNQGGTAR